jgi:hypothetical protein
VNHVDNVFTLRSSRHGERRPEVCNCSSSSDSYDASTFSVYFPDEAFDNKVFRSVEAGTHHLKK